MAHYDLDGARADVERMMERLRDLDRQCSWDGELDWAEAEAALCDLLAVEERFVADLAE